MNDEALALLREIRDDLRALDRPAAKWRQQCEDRAPIAEKPNPDSPLTRPAVASITKRAARTGDGRSKDINDTIANPRSRVSALRRVDARPVAHPATPCL